MSGVRSVEIEIDTRGRLVSDITDRVESFARADGGSGLLHVFLPHATAGLALMETGSGSEGDLEDVIDAVLPREDRYRHRHGSEGHGADHLLPAIISPSLTLAVDAGRVILGTWQSIVVVDTNHENNRRRIRLSFLEG
jgi:secondary thiamine-phosphate synthase enzyme